MAIDSERATAAPGTGIGTARPGIARWFVPGQVAVAVLLFVFLAGDGLGEFFSGDDLMNLYKYLQQPLSHWLQGVAVFWSSAYYRPLGAVAYLVPYSLFGFHPLPFRVLVYALLLVNLGLYFRFVTKLGQSARLASFALLLCSYHSAFAGLYQSYGMIYDVSSYLFFFGGLLGYLTWRGTGTRSRRRIGLALVFVCFFLGLSCKETVAALPAVLAAYDLILGGGIRRDGWRWPLRGGWPILVCSALDIVYALGKLTGAGSLVNHPLYAPHFTLDHYAFITAHYLRELFYLSEPAPAPAAALMVLGAMLLAGLLLRSRLMLFSLASIVVTQLPVSFIAPRGAFAIYIALGFWALYAAALLDAATPLLRRPWPCAIAFLALAGLLLAVHLRWKPRYDRDYSAQTHAYRELDEQLDRWRFHLPRKGHVLVTDDPFPTHWGLYDTLFLFSLHAGTTHAGVVRAKYETAFPPLSEMKAYDYVIDYEGEWRLLKGPGHPLTSASAARIQQLAHDRPVRLVHGFELPTPDRWRWAQESFGVEVICPRAGTNWLVISLMAPQAVVLSAEEKSGKLFEGLLPAGQALPFAVTIQAARAGEAHQIEFRVRRETEGVGPDPGLIFFETRLPPAIENPPTASFLASKNGGPFTHAVTGKAGDTITYRWSSTNGAFYSSNDVVTPRGRDACGNATGPMSFNTASGTSRAYALLPCQSGFTYTMTYTAAGYGPNASETVTIAVQ